MQSTERTCQWHVRAAARPERRPWRRWDSRLLHSIAFEQAQKERDDLSERTKQGIETARINGKQIGRARGARVLTKKAEVSKKKIAKLSKTFGGNNTDKDLILMLGIDKNTYYKYKKELLADK